MKLITALVISVAMAGVVTVVAGCASCGDKGATGCGSGGCGDEPAKVAEKAPAEAELNTEALAALIRTKVPVTVLDARSGKYDDGRRIPGAKALSASASDDAIAALLPNKDGLIVTYCASLTCPASKALAERLRKLGYKNVIEYPQGIAGWTEAGNSVEKQAK